MSIALIESFQIVLRQVSRSDGQKLYDICLLSAMKAFQKNCASEYVQTLAQFLGIRGAP